MFGKLANGNWEALTAPADNNPQQDLFTPTVLSGRKSVAVSAKLSLRCQGFVPGCGLVIGEEDQTFQRRRLAFIGLETKERWCVECACANACHGQGSSAAGQCPAQRTIPFQEHRVLRAPCVGTNRKKHTISWTIAERVHK